MDYNKMTREQRAAYMRSYRARVRREKDLEMGLWLAGRIGELRKEIEALEKELDKVDRRLAGV